MQPHPNVKRVLIERPRKNSFITMPFRWLQCNQYPIKYYKGRKRGLEACPEKNIYKCTPENAGKCTFASLYRDVRRTFGLGVIWFDIPEFIWLAYCSIITDHYSFQYLKAMLFSYLNMVGKGGPAWLQKIFNVLEFL